MTLLEKANKAGKLYREIGKKEAQIKHLHQQIKKTGFHQEVQQICDLYKKNK